MLLIGFGIVIIPVLIGDEEEIKSKRKNKNAFQNLCKVAKNDDFYGKNIKTNF